MRGTLVEPVLSAAAVLVAVVSLGLYSFSYRRAPEIDVGSIIEQYAEVSVTVPPDERVGFLQTMPDPTDAAAALFLAQFALAPRVVDSALEDVRFIVTAPGAPSTVNTAPQLIGFELRALGTGGIRIYQRVP